MIKLNLVVTPGTCNLLLMAMAAAQEQIGIQMDAIRAQGDAQMRPPEPVAEPAEPAPADEPEAPSAAE